MGRQLSAPLWPAAYSLYCGAYLCGAHGGAGEPWPESVSALMHTAVGEIFSGASGGVTIIERVITPVLGEW
jgi:hypothetical protein